MNIRKLKAKCIEQGMTITELCDKIAVSNATLYRRMNKNTLTIQDAMAISNALKLSPAEMESIFLTTESQI